MKKKLFENIGDNMFKLRKNLNESVIDTTLTITNPETDVEEDIAVTVTYTYYPASRGARERGTGAPLEPDEDASIEIESVKDSTGKEIDVSDSDLKQLESEISDTIRDADDYEAGEYADHKRDARDNDDHYDRYDESKKKRKDIELLLRKRS